MTRPRMTAWYNPAQLTKTGIRVAISTVFGEFADRREAIAAANVISADKIDPIFDYSKIAEHSGLYLDYLADTGDGWDSTYAMARLLAEAELSVAVGEEQLTLPRGRVLVLGGDQVYPTASRDEYDARLLDPFDLAAEHCRIGEPRPDLYAIPGNHDWYDGLNAFFGLFCRARPLGAWSPGRRGKIIGGRFTRQSRSYFAIKLPGGWWMWGTDAQLKGFIDQPQIDFFSTVASKWMDPGSKLILCTGAPSWQYVDQENPEKEFRNFSYIERLAGLADRDHKVRLILSGDSHHYAHYLAGGAKPLTAQNADRHYLTCGGGGAFLHPTHNLRSEISFETEFPEPGVAGERGKYPRKFVLARSAGGGEAIYPDRKTSRRLTWGNLGFAFKNWQFTLTLLPLYVLFTWLLHANAQILDEVGLPHALATVEGGGVLEEYFRIFLATPWPLVLFSIATAGYYYFADTRRWWTRLFTGGVHGLAQGALVLAITILMSRLAGRLDDWVIILAIGAVGALASASLFGIYLLVMLNLFGKHWNEAFSALAIKDYKSMLRMRFDGDGTLTVHSIGLDKVPSEPRSGPVRSPQLNSRLIDDVIVIR